MPNFKKSMPKIFSIILIYFKNKRFLQKAINIKIMTVVVVVVAEVEKIKIIMVTKIKKRNYHLPQMVKLN